MRAARIDANQVDIVKALRAVGCRVLHLHKLGGGVPDLLISTPGHRKLWLVEIKDGSKIPSKRRLTPDEAEFHREWEGNVVTLDSVDGALWWVNRLRRVY